MRHRATAKFWKRYEQLPITIQELARKNFSLLKGNPAHPSLNFKPLQPRNELWAARVGDHFRALAIEEGDALFWFWIGSHEEYNKLIRQL